MICMEIMVEVVDVYVIIMGGGNLGFHVAVDLIADTTMLQLLKKMKRDANYWPTQLDTTVICGSGTDRLDT